jgi:prepilin-type N-terminal cleavage/methylation domain-containing protein
MTKRNGFSLIELVVVALVLTVLASIAIPMVLRAKKASERARVALDLQALSVGLAAYHADFKSYPVFSELDASPERGARLLCRAMVGMGPKVPTSATAATSGYDGNDGTGFRAGTATPGPDGSWGTNDDQIPYGPVRGPYVQPDKFRIGVPVTGATVTDADAASACFLTGEANQPILYYPVRAGANYAAANGHVATHVPGSGDGINPAVNFHDNSQFFTDQSKLRAMLGDYNDNGRIDAGETMRTKEPFILWAAGEDEIFGPKTADKAGVAKCDDVTNYSFAD